MYVISTRKLNVAGQKWASDLSDYIFTIHYKPGVENIVADALSRPTKLDRIGEGGKQVTISPEEVSPMLSSKDNSFKEKSMWIAT